MSQNASKCLKCLTNASKMPQKCLKMSQNVSKCLNFKVFQICAYFFSNFHSQCNCNFSPNKSCKTYLRFMLLFCNLKVSSIFYHQMSTSMSPSSPMTSPMTSLAQTSISEPASLIDIRRVRPKTRTRTRFWIRDFIHNTTIGDNISLKISNVKT
jgi:hypothetical protein